MELLTLATWRAKSLASLILPVLNRFVNNGLQVKYKYCKQSLLG